MENYTPKPGDFFLCQISGFGGFLIRAAQAISGDASRYTHAGIILDKDTIIEAMPGGARIVSIDTILGRRPLAVSFYGLTDQTRQTIVESARSYEGIPYSFLDYLCLGLLAIGIRPKKLRDRVHDSGNMICSQLVDKAYQTAGVHLFDDGRNSGDVTPGDLAHVGNILHVYTGPWVD